MLSSRRAAQASSRARLLRSFGLAVGATALGLLLWYKRGGEQPGLMGVCAFAAAVAALGAGLVPRAPTTMDASESRRALERLSARVLGPPAPTSQGTEPAPASPGRPRR